MSSSAAKILTKMCDHRLLLEEEEAALYYASRVDCYSAEEEKAQALARDTLLRHNIRAIVKIAHKNTLLHGPGIILILVAAGIEALATLLDRKGNENPFDPSIGRLQNFARQWIERKIILKSYDMSIRSGLKGPAYQHMRRLKEQSRYEEISFVYKRFMSLDAPLEGGDDETENLMGILKTENDRMENPEDTKLIF